MCVAPDYPILGFSAGGPWNPLQAFYNVHVGMDDPTNDVVESKQEGNTVYMRQENPWQFTKTSRVDGIVFEEWVTLHDAYAEIKYAVSYKGPSRWTRAPQEMPAIFTGYSMNDHGFYYDGDKPFTGDAEVVRMGHEKRFLKLPPPPENGGRYMRAEDAYKGRIREGWWSICNQPEDMCMTVVCFSDLMESVDFNLNKTDGNGYATPQSAIASIRQRRTRGPCTFSRISTTRRSRTKRCVIGFTTRARRLQGKGQSELTAAHRIEPRGLVKGCILFP